ncbi:hypothetical protein CF319_g8423 [Tilletia indica]|nr:hypothetical protein CF319_g8423 [Tilletia indica]
MARCNQGRPYKTAISTATIRETHARAVAPVQLSFAARRHGTMALVSQSTSSSTPVSRSTPSSRASIQSNSSSLGTPFRRNVHSRGEPTDSGASTLEQVVHKYHQQQHGTKMALGADEHGETTVAQILSAILGTLQDLRSDISYLADSRQGGEDRLEGSSQISVQERKQIIAGDREVCAETAKDYTEQTGIKLDPKYLFTSADARAAYAKHKKVTSLKPSQAIPVEFYLRDEDGDAASPDRVGLVKELFRTLVASLEDLEDRRVKDAEGRRVGTKSMTYYKMIHRSALIQVFRDAAKQIPELRYCRNHWKAFSIVDRRLKSIQERDAKGAKTVAKAEASESQMDVEADDDNDEALTTPSTPATPSSARPQV